MANPRRPCAAGEPALVTDLDTELRRVLEELRDGILVADQQGRILFANQALADLSGYPLSDLPDLRVEDLVPAAEREAHERRRVGYHRAASPPRPMGAGLDIRFRRRDGSAFAADIALSPVQTAGGVTVVIAAVREKLPHRPDAGLAHQLQRVERDLHERALQNLFGLSLNLQTMAAQVSDGALSDRLEGAVRQLDDVMRDLRNYIFGLRPGILSTPAPVPEDPVRDGVEPDRT